jgi:DNA-directed RNA polymerase subunit K/omega
MSVKDTKAEVNTITYDKDKIEDKVGSIYEAIVIMGKRAEQINAEIRTELHNKLDEFAVHNSTLEEVFENREQIENITKNFLNLHLSQFRNGLMTMYTSEKLKTDRSNQIFIL